jgi:hypothetical protein
VNKILAVSYISTILILAPHVASAQCNNTSPAGAWGFTIQGFDVVATQLAAVVTRPADSKSLLDGSEFSTNRPFGDVGIIVFDGNGHVMVTQTVSIDGQISQFQTFTGTYSVNANCTFTLLFHGNPSIYFSGVFANGVNEFRIMATQSGVSGTGSGQRISGSGVTIATTTTTCNTALPAGSWGYYLHGYSGVSSTSINLLRERPKVLPIEFLNDNPTLDAIGTIVFDGAGHLTVTETLSQNGQLTESETSTGTYAVNSDCSFSMLLHGGLPVFYNGVFVNGVSEFFVIDATTGDVVTGSGTRQ